MATKVEELELVEKGRAAQIASRRLASLLPDSPSSAAARWLGVFYNEVLWHWWRALRRRSHKHQLPWDRFCQFARRRLPQPRVFHPYPDQRLRV